MATEVTLGDLGFEPTATSPLTAEQCEIVAAALDAPGSHAHGDELPLLWHWAHFTPRARTAALGPDGHPPTPAHLHDRYPRRMWASGEIDAPGRLTVGEPAERRSRIVERKERDGGSGPLLIVTVEHRYVQRGDAGLVERQTLVYRTPGGPVPAPEGDHVPQAGPGGWVERHEPTPVELFRFSAITFNSHRIHYDEAWARDVEGYPGLVVHGPLTAVRVAASMERRTGRPLRHFRFRAMSPLFVGSAFHLVGAVDGDDVSVQVVRNDGAAAMEASGVLGAEAGSTG
jgi:3-methylfumaryl-CoA hydratase